MEQSRLDPILLACLRIGKLYQGLLKKRAKLFYNFSLVCTEMISYLSNLKIVQSKGAIFLQF